MWGKCATLAQTIHHTGLPCHMDEHNRIIPLLKMFTTEWTVLWNVTHCCRNPDSNIIHFPCIKYLHRVNNIRPENLVCHLAVGFLNFETI
jgi:hypothetical protein